jgi:hypothetical protein
MKKIVMTTIVMKVQRYSLSLIYCFTMDNFSGRLHNFLLPELGPTKENTLEILWILVRFLDCQNC